MFTWKGCGTADASTCSREPLQNVSHGSSSDTWQTLLGNPGNMHHKSWVSWGPVYRCPFIPVLPYRGPPQGLTFSSLRSFHTSVSLWQPVKNKQPSLKHRHWEYLLSSPVAPVSTDRHHWNVLSCLLDAKSLINIKCIKSLNAKHTDKTI